MIALRELVNKADGAQSRFWPTGFGYAVFKKYSNDGAGRLAALLAYYGFISLFPLALMLVTILNLVLRNNEELRNSLVEQLFGPQYSQAVLNSYDSLPSSGWPLVIGLIGLLLTGMGAVSAFYVAVNQIWGVPWRQRFGTAQRYLRIIATLCVLGLGAIAVAAAGVVAGTLSSLPGLARVGLAVAAVVVATGLLAAATSLLTAARVRAHEYWLGCVLGGAVVGVVFTLGSQFVARLVSNASVVYGAFATVIGILSLLYITAQGVIVCMEISAVRARRLWPRGLDINVRTGADRRAYEVLARIEERAPTQRNIVTFDDAEPNV